MTLSYVTVPRISRLESDALALPRLIAIPAAVAVEDALHPIRAAQLAAIPSPPLPIAARRTDRGQAGDVPRQYSFQPPEKFARCVPVRLPACQNELDPEIEMEAFAEEFDAPNSQLVRHPTKFSDPAQPPRIGTGGFRIGG